MHFLLGLNLKNVVLSFGEALVIYKFKTLKTEVGGPLSNFFLQFRPIFCQNEPELKTPQNVELLQNIFTAYKSLFMQKFVEYSYIVPFCLNMVFLDSWKYQFLTVIIIVFTYVSACKNAHMSYYLIEPNTNYYGTHLLLFT